MKISFNCPNPDCPAHITTDISEVLRLNFKCNHCQWQIHPSEIFNDTGLDFHAEMGKWITEACVVYFRHICDLKKAMKGMAPPGEIRKHNAKCALYAGELMIRTAIYLGDNEAIQDIQSFIRRDDIQGGGGSTLQ